MVVELTVVIPAHDEEAGISAVLSELVEVLDGAVATYEIVVVDDASTDRTAAILDELAATHGCLRVLHLRVNVGHGPALRAGWDVAGGGWVGHLDGDGEVPASELVALWARRDGADLVLGVRAGRESSVVRQVVSTALRGVVRVTAGRDIADANVPCKLVRREWLGQLLAVAPTDAFAPSVLLAVTVARRGGRILEVPVTVRSQPHRRSWLVPTRLVSGCARSLRDTVAIASRVARRSGSPPTSISGTCGDTDPAASR